MQAIPIQTTRPSTHEDEVEVVDRERLRGGAVLEHVEVRDEAGASDADVLTLRGAAAAFDSLLKLHPEWPAPEVVDGRVVTHNPVSEFVYSHLVLQEWRLEDVPSALALEPLQRRAAPRIEHVPDGFEVGLMRHSLDAVGIRTRAKVMARAAHRATASVDGAHRWLSLACGAAIPVLEARASIRGEEAPHVTLVDMDQRALDRAEELAEEAGLGEGDVTFINANILRALVASDSLLDSLGRGTMTLVEALGLFEYLPDRTAVRLLAQAWLLLAPGGALVVGNMLEDRRELDLNQRGVGWPGLHLRSVDDLLELVEGAGLPLARTTVTIPGDGIYAVLSVTR